MVCGAQRGAVSVRISLILWKTKRLGTVLDQRLACEWEVGACVSRVPALTALCEAGIVHCNLRRVE